MPAGPGAPSYDLIVVGGGLAGASLAISMVRQGAKVLVLERTQQFRDRIRGEGMHTWGVAEARALGIYDFLSETCAHEARYWATYSGSTLVRRRDLVETTPNRSAAVNFYHPDMQEALLRAASKAGAEVRRGATVTQVSPGAPPCVTVSHNGTKDVVSARLVVGADRRQSLVRRDGGFTVSRDPNH